LPRRSARQAGREVPGRHRPHPSQPDGATATQLTAAAQSVASVVAGYWLNVDENATRVQTMIRFLKNLGY
jgi:hypothetical protein